MKHFVAALLLLGAVPAFCQVSAAIATSDLASQPAAAGSTLKHFDSIDEGVYKGSRPKSDADYRFLQSLHVKYIVDLQVIPLLTRSEQKKAKKYGITLLPGTMNASPFSPIRKACRLRFSPSCRMGAIIPSISIARFGRDRTGMIAALYKMYFQGMSRARGHAVSA